MKGGVATLEDVARTSGVSTATVSRVLNSPNKVSLKNRERVMSAVRELGYSPNFSARALAANRTNTFGAIVPTMESAIFARGVQAFQEELHTHGVTLLVASSSYLPELEEEQVHALTARGADALLLIGHDRPPRVYEYLERSRIPYVVAWVYEEGAGRTSIGFDNRRSMKTLAGHVIEAGHRAIALITAPREQNDRARERYLGIIEALEEHGLDPHSLETVEANYSVKNGARAFAELFTRNRKITAVMCGNDVLAVGAIGKARQLGMSIPADVSITGFDDLEIAEIVTPGLTTVHVPHREMGRGAAKMLVDLCDGTSPGLNVELETSVKWRQSLESPAAKVTMP